MIYKVVLTVGYNEAHFEFNNIEDAGEFAKTILTHSVKSKDSSRKTSVDIRAYSGDATEDEEDDD